MTRKPQLSPWPSGPLIPITSLVAPTGMGKQPDPDWPSSLISADTATSPSNGGMGSASPGLSSVAPGRLLLPPDAVMRTGVEKAAAGAVGPERRDWSPSPPATPDQGLSAFYLSYFDMLYPEDGNWATKGPGASSREEPPEEPEQCPVIDSQAPGGSLDLAPGSLTLEEHSLEQVQSMVVGEVLKDIETACKLLNITAGEPFRTSPSVRWAASRAEVAGGVGGRARCTLATPGPASATPGMLGILHIQSADGTQQL